MLFQFVGKEGGVGANENFTTFFIDRDGLTLREFFVGEFTNETAIGIPDEDTVM